MDIKIPDIVIPGHQLHNIRPINLGYE